MSKEEIIHDLLALLADWQSLGRADRDIDDYVTDLGDCIEQLNEVINKALEI